MATITFITPDATSFVRPFDVMDPADIPENPSPEGELFEFKNYFTGDDGELQLFEIRGPGSVKVEAHAHPQDEVIFVLEGSLRFGNRTCPAGSAVQIKAYTLYGFETGPEGARFLNFRAEGGYLTLTKEGLAAVRSERRSAEG